MIISYMQCYKISPYLDFSMLLNFFRQIIDCRILLILHLTCHTITVKNHKGKAHLHVRTRANIHFLSLSLSLSLCLCLSLSHTHTPLIKQPDKMALSLKILYM